MCVCVVTAVSIIDAMATVQGMTVTRAGVVAKMCVRVVCDTNVLSNVVTVYASSVAIVWMCTHVCVCVSCCSSFMYTCSWVGYFSFFSLKLAGLHLGRGGEGRGGPSPPLGKLLPLPPPPPPPHPHLNYVDTALASVLCMCISM